MRNLNFYWPLTTYPCPFLALGGRGVPGLCSLVIHPKPNSAQPVTYGSRCGFHTLGTIPETIGTTKGCFPDVDFDLSRRQSVLTFLSETSRDLRREDWVS